jgi:hypothetical protein
MFVFTVKATSMPMLKDKLIEAANALYFPEIENLDDIEKEHTDCEPIVELPKIEVESPKIEVNRFVPPATIQITHSGQEVDQRGVPWDARIHSATKALTRDGSWRARRGADDTLVRQIERESRMSAPTIPAIPVVSVIPDIPVIPPSAPVVSVPPLPEPAPAAPVPQVAVISYDPIKIPESTKPAHSIDSFRGNFVQTMMGLIKDGVISQSYIESLNQYFGTKQIWEVTKNEAQVGEIFEQFCALGFITKVG